MGELRKHYFLEKYVEISEKRGKRPHEYDNYGEEKDDNHLPVIDHSCVFCPGNEDKTPEEIGRIGDPWKIRWIENKFSAVSLKGRSNIETDNKYFTYSSNYGKHEVIVNVREHNRDISMCSYEELSDILSVYESRIDELSKDEDIKYVSVFKNEGKKAGTSLVHDHSQVISLNFIPPKIKREYDYIKKSENCPHCEIISIEKDSHRACYENEDAIAFTPYASLFPYEIWLYPKRHITRLKNLSKSELNNFSKIFKSILKKLKRANFSYNYYLKYGDSDNDMHTHLVIIPRINTWAGFEHSTDVIINPVSPETAAKYYRNE
ncbi:MAG: galactose-1-phosphate uridylyltransferase [Candidatus Woesearchaeota archaeon]